MTSDNFVSKRLESALENPKAALDNSVKRVLALKPILARLLKDSLEEFRDLPVADIEHKYIEGTPNIASEAVHEDEGVPVISGTNTEHKSVHEGAVTFDLKFNAHVPKGDGFMQLIVNVEGQNRAKYPILKRGIYYCGRMLSAQYGTVFTNSHYEKLHKVISIWVCFYGSRAKKNTINRYSLKECRLHGSFKAEADEYNLIDVVMLYIGDDKETDNLLLKMLDKIFSSRYNVGEKKQYLQDECGINLTDAEKAEVEQMCNYSDYVEARGEARGKAAGIVIGEAQGKAIGESIGITNARLDDIRSLMETLGLTAEKAMEALKLTQKEQKELMPLL